MQKNQTKGIPNKNEQKTRKSESRQIAFVYLENSGEIIIKIVVQKLTKIFLNNSLKAGGKLAYFEQNILINMRRKHLNRLIQRTMREIFANLHEYCEVRSIFQCLNPSISKTYF